MVYSDLTSRVRGHLTLALNRESDNDSTSDPISHYLCNEQFCVSLIRADSVRPFHK